MKAFNIPLINQKLKICYGNKGVKEWEKAMIAAGQDPQMLKETLKEMGQTCKGLHNAGHIWVEDLSDLSTLFHELFHFVLGIMEYIGSKDEEFHCYVAGYIFSDVINWWGKEIKRGD